MDMNKLYYFYVVAKHQHVTHAAQELHISQPALTKAMRLLEQDLGINLFFKQRRSIKLTASGAHLKKRLNSVFPVLDRIPEELQLLEQQTVHTVRLNVLAASIITTEAIASYKSFNRNVNFQVFQNREDTECDISITTDMGVPDKGSAFSQRYIIEEDIYLAVPANEKFAKLDAINLQDVKDEWFVHVSDTRPFRKLCDSFCLAAGFRPNVTFESDFPTTIGNLINAGTGIGFWTAFSFGKIAPNMKLLPIRQPKCSRKLILGLHDKRDVTQAAKDFYHYLIQYFQNQKESLL